MLMYKPGDKVFVREDLSLHVKYGDETGRNKIEVNDEMVSLAGQEVTIRNVGGIYDYRIKEDCWHWRYEMFAPPESIKDLTVDESDWSGFFSGFSTVK